MVVTAVAARKRITTTIIMEHFSLETVHKTSEEEAFPEG